MKRPSAPTLAAPPAEPARAPRAPVDGLLATLGSLADPTRLRILALLERQELGVVELCEVLQLPQSTVSRHLKVLSDERWLASQRQGTTHLYRMADALEPAARRLWKVARSETAAWATLEQDSLRMERRLATRRQAADAFFAGAAGEWERLRNELYGTTFPAEVMAALLPRDLVVADLGCGTGDLSVRLARHVRRVIAVDRSAARLKAARRRIDAARNVELHRADLEALPVEDCTCDAALLVLALSYVPDPAAVVAEATRILKPGGVLAVADVVQHDDEVFRRRLGQAVLGFAPDAVAGLLDRAGLEAARCDVLPPHPGARGPALFVARATRPLNPQLTAAG